MTDTDLHNSHDGRRVTDEEKENEIQKMNNYKVSYVVKDCLSRVIKNKKKDCLSRFLFKMFCHGI